MRTRATEPSARSSHGQPPRGWRQYRQLAHRTGTDDVPPVGFEPTSNHLEGGLPSSGRRRRAGPPSSDPPPSLGIVRFAVDPKVQEGEVRGPLATVGHASRPVPSGLALVTGLEP